MTEEFISEFVKTFKVNQNVKIRNSKLCVLLNNNNIFSLSAEELEKVEKPIAERLGHSIEDFSCKKADIKNVVENYTKQASTRRQNEFGFSSQLTTNELLTAQKTFVGEKVDTMNKLNEFSGLSKQYTITTKFFETNINKKTFLLDKVTIAKDTIENGELIAGPRENSIYVIPKGNEDKETLICRMDISNDHDNRSFFGNNVKEIISEKASGYHFHFSNAINNIMSLKANSISQDGTECDAISTTDLSDYLKALDGKKVEKFEGKQIDFSQSFGLPFTYMKEKNAYPSCDLSTFIESGKQICKENEAVKALVENYEKNSVDNQGFENYTNALDLFNGLGEIVRKKELSADKLNKIQSFRGKITDSLFESMCNALTQTQNVTKEESAQESENGFAKTNDEANQQASNVEKLTLLEESKTAEKTEQKTNEEVKTQETEQEKLQVKENQDGIK